jgi:hypothetical protein
MAFEYQVKKSKRKTMSLEIKQDGAVLVRVPNLTPDFLIKKFVQQNGKWIEKKRAKAIKRHRVVLNKHFVPGEKFLFLGEEYDLKLIAGKGLDLDGDFKLGLASQDKAREVFEKWYKQEFRSLIEERVEYFADMFGYKYDKLRISSAKTRWGSCSSNKTLSFVWRLVMAPMEVIDYVAVHELAHLKHMDHSSRFWNEVERMMPDYKQHKAWLKENGWRLVI